MEWKRNPNLLLFRTHSKSITGSFWSNSALNLVPIGTNFNVIWVVGGGSALEVCTDVFQGAGDVHKLENHLGWFCAFSDRKEC